MKSYEWNKAEQSFVEVDDPTYFEDIQFADEGIDKAGYCQEISSFEQGGDGAGIRVYSASTKGKPLYFIKIEGMNHGLASLVAKDFPALMETLKQIHPLLTLIGLDQVNSAQVEAVVDQEFKKREQLKA